MSTQMLDPLKLHVAELTWCHNASRPSSRHSLGRRIESPGRMETLSREAWGRKKCRGVRRRERCGGYVLFALGWTSGHRDTRTPEGLTGSLAGFSNSLTGGHQPAMKERSKTTPNFMVQSDSNTANRNLLKSCSAEKRYQYLLAKMDRCERLRGCLYFNRGSDFLPQNPRGCLSHRS